MLIAACPISDVEHVVEAVLVDAQTAAWLDIDPAAPCLSMIRRTWSGENLISYARLIHPGDRYKLRSSMRGLGVALLAAVGKAHTGLEKRTHSCIGSP